MCPIQFLETDNRCDYLKKSTMHRIHASTVSRNDTLCIILYECEVEQNNVFRL